MSIIVERYNKIKSNIEKISNNTSRTIVAVSKTFSLDHIMPLIDHGHIHYGENKVQEAESKWSEIKNRKKDLKLHMIGKLQSNKAKKAVQIFDYIHSLDSQKLADILAKNQQSINKSIKYFIQVNIGNEIQKSGIEIDKLEIFYKTCTENLGLNIIGLMCLPPKNMVDNKYFELMKKSSNNLKLKNLSMGMSSDYLSAYKSGATYLRIGSKIFGERA